ncbi:MAG: hypothetical protein V3U21_02780 [Thermodesulfobacteriota bacterium]
MKTKHYYLSSVLIFLAGALIFSIYVYRNYSELNEYLVSIDMPGEGTIKIDAPGEYDFYYELEDGKEDLLDEDNSIPDFAIKVKGKDGKYIAVIKSPATKKYEYMKRVGTSIFQINPTEAGMYEVSGSYTNINNNKNFQLKYDRGFSRKRSVTVVNAQALFLFPIIVSLILFLYAYSRDRL